MDTISERIFKGTLSAVPLEMTLAIGEDIAQRVRDNQPLDAAIFIATARGIKLYAGECPPANGRGKWFETLVAIGEDVYAMCLKRFKSEDSTMMMRQTTAAVYRGITDLMIAKTASIKAKVYAIGDD